MCLFVLQKDSARNYLESIHLIFICEQNSTILKHFRHGEVVKY